MLGDLATALHSAPENFPQRELFGVDEWICDGGAVIFEPFGGLCSAVSRNRTGIHPSPRDEPPANCFSTNSLMSLLGRRTSI